MNDLAQVIDTVLVNPVIYITSSDLLCMYLKSLIFKNFRANNAFLRGSVGLLNTLDKNGRQRDCIKVQPNVSREKFFWNEVYSFHLFFSNVEWKSMRFNFCNVRKIVTSRT